MPHSSSLSLLWRCAGWYAKPRTTPAKVRHQLTGGPADGHIVDAMAGSARGLARGGDQSIAACGGRKKLHAGAGGHHGFAVGIAGEGERRIGQRKQHAPMTGAVTI